MFFQVVKSILTGDRTLQRIANDPGGKNFGTIFAYIASSAYREIMDAHLYQYVIPNHDGEDSDHWEATSYPVGDARHALEVFKELLKGNIPDGVEQWPADLIQ